MLASLRWIAPLLALTSAVVAVMFAQPAWLRRGGASPASVLLVSPDERTVGLQSRLHAKGEVVDRLIADELSLVEAAAWFRYLNEHPADLAVDYCTGYPGDSPGEKLCRQVISWARARLNHQRTPSDAEETVRRLEGELDNLLCRGAVELPW